MKNDYLYFDQFHLYCFGLNIYTKDSFNRFVEHAHEKYGDEKAKKWLENNERYFKSVTVGNLTFTWLKK